MVLPVQVQLDLPIRVPDGVHALFWTTVLVMTLDVVFGYWIARSRGEAHSNRLREGILRRVYMMTMLMVLTLFAGLEPNLSTITIVGEQVNFVWFVYLGTIASELKSLAEKGERLGLTGHPVVVVLKALAGRWVKRNDKKP